MSCSLSAGRQQTRRLQPALRVVQQKMSARHIGSKGDTNRFPARKQRARGGGDGGVGPRV